MRSNPDVHAFSEDRPWLHHRLFSAVATLRVDARLILKVFILACRSDEEEKECIYRRKKL